MTARYDVASETVTAQLSPTQLADGRRVQGYAAIKVGRLGIVSVNVLGIASDSLDTRAIRDRFLTGFRTAGPRRR